MMKTFASAAAFACVIAGSAAAQTWTVDHDRSRLGFEGTQGGQTFEGRFEDWSAEIVFDLDDLDPARADVTIDMGSARTGAMDRDGALPGRDWFAVSMFPEAQFVTTAIRRVDNGFEADATLTIKGVSRDVVLPFTLDVADGEARMQGVLEIVRTRYKVGEGQWASGQTVGLDVRIVVDLVAIADGAVSPPASGES